MNDALAESMTLIDECQAHVLVIARCSTTTPAGIPESVDRSDRPAR